MNKKGFSLIEILAVIIIIGVISSIGIVAISGNIERTRKSAFTDMARTYAEAARAMNGSDLLSYEPKEGEAIIIPFSKIEGSNIEHGEKTAYGNLIDEYCYVAITKENGKFKYYVTMVDETNHTMVGVEYNDISDKMVKLGEDINDLKPIDNPIGSYSITINERTLNIARVRAKYETTYEETDEFGNTSTKTKTLTGYYANDGSQNKGSSNVKGQIDDFDQTVYSKSISYKGNEHTIVKTDILYVVVR